MIENTIPILRVRDVAGGADYYANTLGFTEQWRAGDTAGMVRDGHAVYLTDGEQGQLGGWVWIGVENLDAIHAEYVANGASIIMPPTEYPWAREFRVEDPDGNVLRIGGAPADDGESTSS